MKAKSIAAFAMVILAVLAFSVYLFRPSTPADLLEDSEAFPALLAKIEEAESKVYVVMYVIKYDPGDADDPINSLLQALVSAKARGVEVRVLVDDETLQSYPQTVSFLKERGIEVRLDEGKRVRTHVKMVLVDDELLYVGSHNWTESAMKYNHELGILLRDETLAKEAKDYFLRLWNAGRAV